jgi:hypothetical protein
MNIINPIEEIKTAIPQLDEITDRNNSIFVTNQEWNNRIKTIATKNYKKYNSGKYWISLMIYFNPCVICVHDGKLREINKEKYLLIRKYLMSEEFNKQLK